MPHVRIVSLADPAYFGLLKGLVASAAVNFPTATMHVVLVNVGAKDCKLIKTLHPNIIVEEEKVDFSKLDKRCYCARRRAFLFKRIRATTDDILLWIDADCLIRRNCDNLANELATCDLAAVLRSNGTMRSGIIAVGSTHAVWPFVKKYEKALQTDHSWMADQIHLNKIYKSMKSELNFKALSDVYCDVWFRKKGIIWAAKSDLKSNPKFQEEMRKYVSD